MIRIPVRVASDGTTTIDGETLPVPAGVLPADAVVHALKLEAAGAEHPVLADIRDDQSKQTLALLVHPDGRVEPQPAPQTVPSDGIRLPPLSDPHKARFDAVCVATNAGDLVGAASLADALLLELTHAQGPDHPHTLIVAEARAHLAWLSSDFTQSLETWAWIAGTWLRILGPGHRAAGTAARNAFAAWRQLSPDEAVQHGPALVEVLTHVAPNPETNRTVLALCKALDNYGRALRSAG